MTFYNRNGKLYVRINGRRISTKLEDTPNNRKLVKSYYKNDEFFNKFGINNSTLITVVEHCENVMEEKSNTLKHSTLRSYNSILKTRIKPYFKNITVVEVTPLFLKDFYKSLPCMSTLRIAKAILKDVFEESLLNKVIKSNPFNEISNPKFQSSYEINPFNYEELKLILNHESHIKNLLAIALLTGMRAGEIIALKWSDIDFKNMEIDVNKTVMYGIEGTPKTASSKAVIDLPQELLPFLKNQQKRTGLREYLFYSAQGKRFDSTISLSYYYKKVLKSLNIEYRGFHQTRHTFASLKLSMGERLEWVSFMLRHKNPSVTLQKYYKYIPRKKEKRVLFDVSNKAQKRHTI